MNWSDLSMKDRASYIKLRIENGITDLGTIREVYNKFAKGGPHYTLFGLNDNNQDPQAVMTYKGGVVLPEITVTPKKNYIHNPYDNINIYLHER